MVGTGLVRLILALDPGLGDAQFPRMPRSLRRVDEGQTQSPAPTLYILMVFQEVDTAKADLRSRGVDVD